MGKVKHVVTVVGSVPADRPVRKELVVGPDKPLVDADSIMDFHMALSETIPPERLFSAEHAAEIRQRYTWRERFDALQTQKE